jgi:hypothetical protein
VLILSRDSVLPRLNEVIVVPATRTIRGIDTEVFLTEDDGMPTACALNFDHVHMSYRKVSVIMGGTSSERFARSGWARPSPTWTKVVGPRSSERSSLLAALCPTHSHRAPLVFRMHDVSDNAAAFDGVSA